MKKLEFDIYDSHLHMGNLTETDCISPIEVRRFLNQHRIKGGLIMPFAHRGGMDDFFYHLNMYTIASKIGFDLILYINNELLKKIESICSSIDMFHGLKIHPDAVSFSENDLDYICFIAKKQNLPLFIHTGDKETCHSFRFKRIIKKYSELLFVLCHARPAHEAFKLLDLYKNVWIDSSFLPIEEILNRINIENEDRILFGSDFPANRWFPELGDETKWYEAQIYNIFQQIPYSSAKKILCTNYMKLTRKV